jgi:fluoride ion exporter CrcB/FEX
MSVQCLSELASGTHGRNQVVDAFAKIFFTLSISLASLYFGVHIGTALLPYISKTRSHPFPEPWIVNVLNVLSIMVYLATFPTYFTLSASFRHQATAALLFSFPGTFTRYVLSVSLNPRSALLPVGTLVVNEVGTSLLALFHILQGLPSPVSPNACSILQGLGDGYCGCLTTVSTFAAEMRGLTARKRWLYGTISIVAGQVLLVVILGQRFGRVTLAHGLVVRLPHKCEAIQYRRFLLSWVGVQIRHHRYWQVLHLSTSTNSWVHIPSSLSPRHVSSTPATGTLRYEPA